MQQFHTSPGAIPASTAEHAAKDLVPVRKASAETGVEIETIRRWINRGKNGHKLPTYRKPGDSDVMLVSLDLVRRWRDRRVVENRSEAAEEASLHLSKETTAKLRELVRLMSKRLRFQATLSLAVSSAVEHAIRLEELRAKQSSVDTDGQTP